MAEENVLRTARVQERHGPKVDFAPSKSLKARSGKAQEPYRASTPQNQGAFIRCGDPTRPGLSAHSLFGISKRYPAPRTVFR